MVYRIFVEKKPGLDSEASALFRELSEILGIAKLQKLRILNRYDAEGLTKEHFDYAVKTVFSEPQVDRAFEEADLPDAAVFAVEYLPGQFDQRADSAAQCIQLIFQGERPLIRTAKVYALYGELSEEELAAVKKYVINPVEAREASLEKPETIRPIYAVPDHVETLEGFRSLNKEEVADLAARLGLAMDADDLEFCRSYFEEEKRDPTITEIRMIDTYWSDHCRHTTFNTVIDEVRFEDELLEAAWNRYLKTRKELGRTKPICLMDIATLAVRHLRANGELDKLDESEEINACTVKIDVEMDGKKEPWLLLFKNETHNHPTEIEPFGGAATCIGGAIRDPLSGRSYVYGAMRITGAADPLKPVSETLPGKLPQRKIVTTAAAGYSSYGNQIGLATGIVDELYHPGYEAKRMEIGAVIAAAPAENVRRERPAPGDVIFLLGGGTGRDGIGGATGASKAHTAHSVEDCGAEVQKGNAPEERKLQRLFRNPEASRLIKRCNDFGAGGVSVAIGELADGIVVDLNAVPKKYEGLDGTELAISESQERMAVVVEEKDAERFLALAGEENLQAVIVARVQEDRRLVMYWNDRKIVDISRDFLDSNGAEKHIRITPAAAEKKPLKTAFDSGSFTQRFKAMAGDLNCCSKRGLAERFDSTIGAGTVLMPFGGRRQLTPAQAMVQLVSSEKKHTDDCSLMAWGFDPYLSEMSPYHGAYTAVAESVCKLIASGAEFKDVYLTLQEYFEKPGHDPRRWGKPLAALLGAFDAQMDLGIGAIGGKDSMSGSFEQLDVPPTLVSFAVTMQKTKEILSPELKAAGHVLIRLAPEKKENGLPDAESLKAVFARVAKAVRSGRAFAAYTPGYGGIAEAVMKMSFGNGFGVCFDQAMTAEKLFAADHCAFLLEVEQAEAGEEVIGTVTEDDAFTLGEESIAASELLRISEEKLEGVFACNIPMKEEKIPAYVYQAGERRRPSVSSAKPKVLIPAFPGTNCEYDSAKAVADAGAEPEVIVIGNLTADAVARSVERFASAARSAQMIFIPGGFSGGDEPDGSGKFITAFFRSAEVKEAVTALLEKRDGLMLGICNGFQALIKLGLVPYGRILDADETFPTLTFNTIGRHQSRIVRTRIASNKSPWLSLTKPGEIYSVPISHGEGRFLADPALIDKLASNGQIATQYVDEKGLPTMDVHFNPNGSLMAIEGITSPDGRVLGKMGHTERYAAGLYKNVPGNYDPHLFEAAVKYFKG